MKLNLYKVETATTITTFLNLFSAKQYADSLLNKIKPGDFVNVYTKGTGTKPYMTAGKPTNFKWLVLDADLPNPTDITELHWQGGSFGKMDVPESTDTLTVDTFCQWRSIDRLCIEEVVQIMKDTCPGYNGFQASALDIHADTQSFQATQWNIAREGSVCLYGKCPMGLLEELKSNLRDICVDEFNTFENGNEDHADMVEFRAWWD